MRYYMDDDGHGPQIKWLPRGVAAGPGTRDGERER